MPRFAGSFLRIYPVLVSIFLAFLLLSESFGLFYPLNLAHAAPEQVARQFRYFDQTGHSINGAVWRYYNRSGGEGRHGLPLTELLNIKGKYQQFFERSILQFNPDYQGTDHEVEQLPIGSLEVAAKNFGPVTPFVNTATHWYFPESGHSLSDTLLEYWLNNGDKTALGLPLSEELDETDASGHKLRTQYFEFAKLELQPEQKSVQIAALGRRRAMEQLGPAELTAVPQTKLEQPRSMRVPSLMFHYVRTVDAAKDPLGFGLSIKPDIFVKFLDWIQENKYNTVTIAQINDYLRYGIPLPDKAVNIRFDDGHADQWFAYQEMKKRGMTATFYVISRRLELLPSQWQQIDADGFEVAAHTRTHPDLRGVKDLEGEITGSKRDMEMILGHPVRTFAYPYGKYGPEIMRIVRESGFETAVSTNGGYGWTPDSYFTQPTISVTGDDTVTSFAAKITVAPRASLSNSTPPPPAPATTKAVPAKTVTTPPKPANNPPAKAVTTKAAVQTKQPPAEPSGTKSAATATPKPK